MTKDVTSRTASASAALLGARMFVKMIDLILMLVLARILVPADFALVAMAMIFIQFTEAVLEIPVIQALIRTPTVTESMLDTAFTISLLRAILVTLLVLAAAPIAMNVFHDDRLGPLMALLALSPALRGLINPRLVMYARKLNYVPEASIDVIAKIVTTCVAVPIALTTRSYWSLAVMTVLTPVTMLICSYAFARYRPRLSLKDWPIFSNMIGWTTVSQIFSAANWQVDIFALGRSMPADLVGKYSVSQTLAGAPNQVFIQPIMRPFIAAFSELRTPEAMRPGYLTASSAVVTAVAPILGLIIALAEPIVSLLFNEAWSGATTFLVVLTIVAMIALPAQSVSSVALAMDRAQFNTIQALVGLCVKAPLLFLGLHYYGLQGFLAGQIIGMSAWTICGAIVVRHLLKLPILDQLRALLRPFIGLAALALVIYLMRPMLDYSSTIALVLTVIMTSIVGMIVYWATVLFLWRLARKPDGIEKLVSSLMMSIMKKLRRRTS